MTLRILLADDHDVVRRGLKELLEEQVGWTVCAEAANGREAVELAIKTRPQVAVLDFSMPELNGLEATRRIRAACPATEVLVFTMHESEELVAEVFAAGARGYLVKSDAPRHIVAAIEALAAHQPFFSASVTARLLEAFLRDRATSAGEDTAHNALTAREREVVQLLAEGRRSKDIARRLGVSVKTVETHRAAAMHKLKLRSTAELVRYAIRNNMIEA